MRTYSKNEIKVKCNKCERIKGKHLFDRRFKNVCKSCLKKEDILEAQGEARIS